MSVRKAVRWPSSSHGRAQFAPLAGGIVIGIGRFLARPDLFGDVAQVDANTGPGGGAAAHRVDQDVVHGEMRGGSSVLGFPAFETGQGSVAIGRVGDGNERHFGARLGGGASARGCDSRRLSLCAAKVRRPRGIGEAFGFVFGGEFQSFSREPGWRSISACGSPIVREALGHGEDGEVGRVAVRDLTPVEGVETRASGSGRTE